MAPPSEPIATRDIDSTPPAITSSPNPERIDLAARLTDSSPEPQKRFSCTPATESGIPAAVAAARARLKAITAQETQAALATYLPEGRWASALSLSSAMTCSTIAWSRWRWSAVHGRGKVPTGGHVRSPRVAK